MTRTPGAGVKGEPGDEPAGVAAASCAPLGKLETTAPGLHGTLARLGRIVAPAGDDIPGLCRAATPHGADDPAIGRHQGQRLAAVTGAPRVLRV